MNTNSNIDSFLASLFGDMAEPARSTPQEAQDRPEEEQETPEPEEVNASQEPEPEILLEPEEEEAQETHALSGDEFDDVLRDIGFITGETDDNMDEEEEFDEEVDTGIRIDVTPAEPMDSGPTTTIDTEPETGQEQGQEEPNTDALEENSPTLTISDAVSRFSGTSWFNEIQKTRITLAGLGGIGSNAAFQLARMSPAALFLYDGDDVEEANMSGQLYSRDHVGIHKADAIASMIDAYTTCRNVYSITSNYTPAEGGADIMMCGFDSMAARKMYYNAWKEHVQDLPLQSRSNCFFCDGRLSIDTLQIFSIRGDDYYSMERYEKDYLFDDSQADETVCSMKQTTYLACMIGSLMVNMLTNFVASTLNPIVPFDVPFFIEYSAQNVLFKVEV